MKPANGLANRCHFCVAVATALLATASAVAQMPSVSVAVASAEVRPVPRVIEVVGNVQPARRSLIGSEVAGLVSEIPVRQGDWVEKGHLLCRLRDAQIRLEHENALGQLGELQARLDELRAGTRETELRQYKAAVEEAQANYDRWDRELTRIRGLYEKSSASAKEYNDTYSDFLVARFRLKLATGRYDEGVEGPRPEVIAQAEQAVAAQKAEADRLADRLAQTEIYAPYQGSVVRLACEVGEWIAEGGQVLELVELETVLVRVDVPESAISSIQVGQNVWVYFDALKERLEGHVRHVIAQADLAARTFPVEIEFANSDHRLLAGMFGRATMTLGQTEPSVVVPKDAIIERQGTTYVVAVMHTPQGTMGTPIPVTRGGSTDEWVAVTSGNIAPGMQIVIRGNEWIPVPMPVQVVPAEQITGMPAASQPTSRPAQARQGQSPDEQPPAEK